MYKPLELALLLKVLNKFQSQPSVLTPVDSQLNLAYFLLCERNDSGLQVDESSIDWTLFYNLVIKHRVWFLTQRVLKIDEPSVSAEVALSAITTLCDENKQHLLLSAAETIRISRLFVEHSIKHCFVKGVILNSYLYGALCSRPCSDIDLWVDMDNFEMAVTMLLSLGYHQKTPGYSLQGFKKKYYFKHRHDFSFYHYDRKILVELHFKLDYLTTRFSSCSDMVMQSIDLMGSPVVTLQDNYHLLYLMIHGAIHGWSCLRWLHDIALYINSHRCDLDAVLNLAKQIECETIVEQTLILVHDFFQVYRVLPWIKYPSKRAIQLANISKEFIISEYSLKDGIKNVQMFIKRRFYLFIIASRGNKIKTVLSDFIKLDEVFSYVTFPKGFSFMYYVLYPLWVMRFIIKSVNI